MSRIQQDWLLPRIEQDNGFRERFYSDDQSLEPDYNPLTSINTVMVLIVTTNQSTLEKPYEKNIPV